MKNIVLIIGTRPNFIKAFPVYEALKSDFKLTMIHTGQHYDDKMSKIFFDQLNFPLPDINLSLDKNTKAGDFDNKLYIENTEYLKNKDMVINDIIAYKGDLGQLGEIRDKLEVEFKRLKPDLVIVFGDVTSTLASSISCKMLDIKIAHIESGLRSGDIRMPEEVNRILTDHISNYYFVTEQCGVDNLKKEGIIGNVYLVGNTMIDTQKKYLQQALDTKYNETLEIKKNDYILVTLHRPSNVDDMEKLKEIFDDFEELSKTNKLVYTLHPRTKINLEKIGYLEKVMDNKNIILQEPLGYLEFTCLIANCKYVITDSGGIQEETTALDIPCFTLRENTERPCTLIENGGTNKLINKISEIEVENKIYGMGTCRINFNQNDIIYNPIFYSTSALDIKEEFEIMFENKQILNIDISPYFGMNNNYHKFTNLQKPKNKIFIIEICSLHSFKYNNNIIPYKCLNENIKVDNISITLNDTYEILSVLVKKYQDNRFIFIPPFINNEIRKITNMYNYRNEILNILNELCINNYNCHMMPYPEETEIIDFYHFSTSGIKNQYLKIIEYLKKNKMNIFVSENANKEIKNIIFSLYNNIYIPLGYACRTALILKKINKRNFSLPFDYLNCDLCELLNIMKSNFEFANEKNLIVNNGRMFSKLYGYKSNIFLHYNDKYKYISLVNRYKNVLKTPNIIFISIYLNNGTLYRLLHEYTNQVNELNNYISKIHNVQIKKIIINCECNSNTNLRFIQTYKECKEIETPQEIINEIDEKIRNMCVLVRDDTVNNGVEIIKSLLNYKNDIEFHTNIGLLLKLTDVYIIYKDYIYMEIGKLYKHFMKSYSILSLHYFTKAINIKNGVCDYNSKLCFYYENIIYSLNKDRALLKIESVNNNDIKYFYKGMYKYIHGISDYEDELKKFMNSGTKIYQSIPLETYTFNDDIYMCTNYNILEEYKLEALFFNAPTKLLIASSDIKYFNLYGDYLIKSFLRYKNEDEILIIDIINNNNILTLSTKQIIDNYNENKNVKIIIKHTMCENIKAYSSTLRFARAFNQKESKCLVIDIDSIILNSLKDLFLDMDKYDIGSRILEKTYPWQMYTAGFCYFNNTKNSNYVLTSIYNCINYKMIFNKELWWIDQNALEYGIRINKDNLKIKNYFGIKDKYIISPTGSTKDKINILDSFM